MPQSPRPSDKPKSPLAAAAAAADAPKPERTHTDRGVVLDLDRKQPVEVPSCAEGGIRLAPSYRVFVPVVAGEPQKKSLERLRALAHGLDDSLKEHLESSLKRRLLAGDEALDTVRAPVPVDPKAWRAAWGE